ncbi:MAG: GlsB/YeaQ/YmgE family stress response membrane protein [Caulobacteraceae bacterium]|nr:GlsB/YeaQ/YmgE family stress response membrane protein [Caulobacteraceae bacterium]
MEQMGWLSWVIAGIIAGWIAEHVTGRRHGLITNLIVGLVGAFIGGWLASTMNFTILPAQVFLNNLIIATIGAILLLLIFGMIRRR